MFFSKKNKITIEPPVKGKFVELDQVPDEVFSSKMLGDGVAIIPEDGLYKAPISGTIGSFFPTGHAFGIEGEDGLEVLVHIGIDTVELKGEGFKPLKKIGDKVTAGEPIVEADLDLISESGRAIITPLIITSSQKELTIEKDLANNKVIAILK